MVPAEVPIAMGTMCSCAKACEREHLDQHRHHGEAATDAEEPGHEADDGAERQEDRDQREVQARAAIFSMAFHSAGVTGVIDRRLPLRRVIMSASAGASRISDSGIRRVLRTSFTSTFNQRGSSRFDLGS